MTVGSTRREVVEGLSEEDRVSLPGWLPGCLQALVPGRVSSRLPPKLAMRPNRASIMSHEFNPKRMDPLDLRDVGEIGGVYFSLCEAVMPG